VVSDRGNCGVSAVLGNDFIRFVFQDQSASERNRRVALNSDESLPVADLCAEDALNKLACLFDFRHRQ
jgi:hypothetical protein